MLSSSPKASALLVGIALTFLGSASAQTPSPGRAASLTLPAPVVGSAMPSNLMKQTGAVQVMVRMTDPPLATMVGANAKRVGSTMSLAQRQAYVASLKTKQDALSAQIVRLGGTEVARLSKVYNGLVISADASKLLQIAALPGVSALKPIVNHQISLTDTVPYIGAKALQDLGVTGAGVKIAILDSGIDYTHYNLGGSGSATDFAAATTNAAVTAPAGLFPSAKVIGGYDFVGETWPNTTNLAPDPNPIDTGVGSGHGTHVADIAAGASLDGLHKGVAPGAKLYAVKVCSSVSTSCSGIAILQGLEWAMDPKGDSSFDGAADVVNLSLGANYGMRENPSTEAVSTLVRFGMVVAVAAGNAGDRPYIVSSPSNAPEAISVAQTETPTASAYALKVNSPSSIAGSYGNTATVDWAPIGAGFTGNVVYVGTACPGTPLLADPTGKVALIDRGTCSVSLKVDVAARAGAKATLIGLIASGDAVPFSNGGGTMFVPTLVIQQTLSSAIKANIIAPVNVSVDASTKVNLSGSMASTSARGPAFNFSTIKPEIGAPGASVSALNGTGNGQEAFGGTSGATPMIAGSAALLLQKFPTASASEIKARLMNSANTNIFTNPALLPGELAPITRIGAGEVRVDKAAAGSTGVWDATNAYSVGLAFGTVRATGITTFSKKVAVRNYSSASRVYTINRTFRYANDAASGAVKLTAPASITVPANASSAFALTLTLDASKLPDWNLYLATDQGTGSLLQQMEFDGYITVGDSTETVSVPWHILPHKSANVVPSSTTIALGGTSSAPLGLSNVGGSVGSYTDAFALTGTSPQDSTVLPPYGGGQAIIDLKAVGVRGVDVGLGANSGVQFAIATYGERAHPAYPAEFDIYVDSNNDGVFDYLIYNSESGGFGLTGQTLVTVVNLLTGTSIARFYEDADLNSSNAIFTVLASDIGLAPTQKFSFAVYAFDNYFTGSATDAIVNNTFTLASPKYKLQLDSFSLPVGASGNLQVTKPAGGATASPSQIGLLLMHADAKTGRESDIITVTP